MLDVQQIAKHHNIIYDSKLAYHNLFLDITATDNQL